MTEQTAVLESGIEICYETFGEATDPTLLLVMGLGGPMGWWSVAFCENLQRRGFHVVRYDNRDTGRSSWVQPRQLQRRSAVVSTFLGSRRHGEYAMNDLAEDAFGLLDALEVEQAHVVGVSMGGMIAQTMALARPERVLTLTSIMASTGRRTVGWQDPRLLPMLFGRSGLDRDSYIERTAVTMTAIGSPAYPGDPETGRRRAEETFDRGWSAAGAARQMLAVISQPDRTAALHTLDVPTLVVHGLQDRMVHVSGGRATAQAIPGADLLLIPGMGHDLPPELDDTICDAIERTTRRSNARLTG
ncbi:MAG: alpha/beta hydrolase [Nocardioidaceae bacterium]|jgi:pimeloyl-ACP methyl ester carboxylesterase|nr:alpha/beta hydrolase [Nocardioidaceae bacterium]